MTPAINMTCSPSPSLWSGSTVEPPAGIFNADMTSITADDTTHTADET